MLSSQPDFANGTKPPSTARFCPVMNDAASLARNTAALATVVGHSGALRLAQYGGEQIRYDAKGPIRPGAVQPGGLGEDTGDYATRRNRVDANAAAADFRRHVERQMDHRGFRRAVDMPGEAAAQTGGAGDGDDAA